MSWAVPEKVLRRMLIERGGVDPTRVSTSTPGNLEDVLPYYRLTTVRGSDDGLTDSAIVDIEVFHRTRSEAADEAERIRSVVLDLGGRADSEGHLVDQVTTSGRPIWLDYRNAAIHRYVASYEISTRPVYAAG